jgi:hypothetical protein
MTRVSDLTLARRRPLRRQRSVAWIAVSAVILVGSASCLGSSNAIDRLTIVNGTPFDVEVKVSDARKESSLILGRAERESSTVNELVTDMGETWVFEFSYGGRVVGGLTVKRTNLERDGWRIEVPSRVARTMRRYGFEPRPEG